ncbi:MAG: ornithine cyclodeaminase family protein [Chloroflexi bacterium]|nr:ornithine cyclodeaminase family protein [Chloroflexota bacterium]
MLLLSAADVRRALPMRQAIETQKRAYAALITGEAALPLRTPVHTPAQNAVTLFMPARVANDLGAKIVSVFPGNPQKNLPIIHGVMIMIDAETGQPAAVMDATYLTALRTGAASGAATDLLARPDSSTAAIFGAGAQARTQLEAVCSVRSIKQAWIYDRDPSATERMIAEVAGRDPIPADLRAAASPREAVSQADIICTATTSTSPVYNSRDVKPGAHVNGIGSYTPEMQENDPELIKRALVVIDSHESALAEAGDLIIPLRDGLFGTDHIHAQLGEIVLGRKPGRANAEQITFFKSCGIAVQDVVAAAEVLRRARGMKLGAEFAL